MVLSREFVHHLKHGTQALNVLAFMEHTWIPDECYFATGKMGRVVLVSMSCNNSPLPYLVIRNDALFSDKFINHATTFVWFPPGSVSTHPIMLTYSDRHYFPPTDLVENDPEFFFIRKVDTSKEKRLKDWIIKYHLDRVSDDLASFPCTLEHSYRQVCLAKQINQLQEAQLELFGRPPIKSLFVVPASSSMKDIVLNLICSMAKFRIHDIVFWSLDIAMHELLLSQGFISIYYRSQDIGATSRIHYSEWTLEKTMNQKIDILDFVMRSVGWGTSSPLVDSIWFLDADTVVLSDFRPFVHQFTDITVMAMIDSKDILYHRGGHSTNTNEEILFGGLTGEVEEGHEMDRGTDNDKNSSGGGNGDDVEASATKNNANFSFLSTTTSKNNNNNNSPTMGKTITTASANSQRRRKSGQEGEKRSAMIERVDIPNASAGVLYLRNRPEVWDFLEDWKDVLQNNGQMDDQMALSHLIQTRGIVYRLNEDNPKVYYLSREYGKDQVEADRIGDSSQGVRKRANVMFLNQLQFVNGHVFFDKRYQEQLADRSEMKLIHTNGVYDVEWAMKDKKIWALNSDGYCRHRFRLN